ncbi:uncharacterized membrane protein (DUF4010 family) [Inhella inkyongensis]|uniref:Uncharacterized membrane protein (DUF4010 family) n=1 Tax=Inhella inkyongensis TaxID=392593 RepID=A0A840SAU5_9BURK|nr:MgtC/SapB family protein [Inhella inkyongensis]MBB5206136.1 uncharacterized membrane protein (DUF4010 family) [Inhella inkyongensis]
MSDGVSIWATGNWQGLAVAAGAGLLIGLERERRKRARGDSAGLRSYTVAALIGALTAGEPVLLGVGALLVAGLALLAQWKNSGPDPGNTSELALFATFLIGVQAMHQLALAAACAVALALLLALRKPLHRLAHQGLSEAQLHDALLLAAGALIALPLIPAEPQAWLGGIRLRPMASLVLLILSLQVAGQLALQWLGPQAGLRLSGLLSGFVSSTATIAALGSRVRQQGPGAAEANPNLSLLAQAAGLSTVATWAQAALILATLAPAELGRLSPVLAAGAATALLLLAALSRLGVAVAPTRAAPVALAKGSALRWREAVSVAVFLLLVSGLVSWAQAHLGAGGVRAGAALGGLADAHAPVAALAALRSAGGLSAELLGQGILLALASNSLTRTVTAALAGGVGFAGRVAAVLWPSWAVAALAYSVT